MEGVGGLAGGDMDDILGGRTGGIESGCSDDDDVTLFLMTSEGETDLTVLTLALDDSESLLEVFFNLVNCSDASPPPAPLLDDDDTPEEVGLRFSRRDSLCWNDLKPWENNV